MDFLKNLRNFYSIQVEIFRLKPNHFELMQMMSKVEKVRFYSLVEFFTKIYKFYNILIVIAFVNLQFNIRYATKSF